MASAVIHSGWSHDIQFRLKYFDLHARIESVLRWLLLERKINVGVEAVSTWINRTLFRVSLQSFRTVAFLLAFAKYHASLLDLVELRMLISFLGTRMSIFVIGINMILGDRRIHVLDVWQRLLAVLNTVSRAYKTTLVLFLFHLHLDLFVLLLPLGLLKAMFDVPEWFPVLLNLFHGFQLPLDLLFLNRILLHVILLINLLAFQDRT